MHAVPDQPWPEFGELVARVPTRDQVERRLERRPGQAAERGAPPHEFEPVLDVEGVDRPGRHGVLRQDVERVRRHRDRLDLARDHPLDRDRAVDQVGPVLREQHPARDLAHLVSGTTDALQPARDRGRRLDLDDQVDLAHVDTEFERARRDDAPQPTGLQVVLDDRALVLRHRAVVRAGEHRDGGVRAPAGGLPGPADELRRRPFGPLGRDRVRRGARRRLRPPPCHGQAVVVRGRPCRHQGAVAGCGEHAFLVDLVEACRQPLGQPPRVREHDGRAVFLDQVDDALFDVRPDRPVRRRLGRVRTDRRRPELGHVVDGHDDPQVEGLLRRRRDDRHRGAAAQEPRDLFRRTDGRGQPDALHGLAEQVVEAFERHGQVCAALARGDRVDLVHDDGVDVHQGLACLRGEHQVERLGRGDEDVRRLAQELLPVGRRGVTAAHTHRDVRWFGTETACGLGDADERAPQVALDVDAQGLERRDVEHPRALLRRRPVGRADEPVDRPQERGQGLAGTGRGDHERVLPGRDGVPRPGLCGGRCVEGAAEPLGGGGGEALEDVRHGPSHPARRHRQQAERTSLLTER
ncbi:conserved hypothetical protein [Curtobacterium sp. 8I-2]|nr:conserved hypothetical protein [Curtobacterium sp. 8I-2]